MLNFINYFRSLKIQLLRFLFLLFWENKKAIDFFIRYFFIFYLEKLKLLNKKNFRKMNKNIYVSYRAESNENLTPECLASVSSYPELNPVPSTSNNTRELAKIQSYFTDLKKQKAKRK